MASLCAKPSFFNRKETEMAKFQNWSNNRFYLYLGNYKIIMVSKSLKVFSTSEIFLFTRCKESNIEYDFITYFRSHFVAV